MKLKTVVAACAAFAMSSMASAGLVKSGDIVTDTSTSYQWYTMTSTVSYSYTQMLSEFANTSSKFYGFRYANKLEIQTLWTDGGLITGKKDTYSALMTMFGQTGTNCCARTDGRYDDQTTNTNVGQAFIVPDMLSATFLADWVSPTSVGWASAPQNTIGNWILKAAPARPSNAVPEPGTFALAGLGFAGLLGARRRKAAR